MTRPLHTLLIPPVSIIWYPMESCLVEWCSSNNLSEHGQDKGVLEVEHAVSFKFKTSPGSSPQHKNSYYVSDLPHQRPLAPPTHTCWTWIHSHPPYHKFPMTPNSLGWIHWIYFTVQSWICAFISTNLWFWREKRLWHPDWIGHALFIWERGRNRLKLMTETHLIKSTLNEMSTFVTKKNNLNDIDFYWTFSFSPTTLLALVMITS